MISEILPILQLVLTFGNVCILGYALLKFISKPHDNLETRITGLEVDVKEIKQSLKLGNDRFKDQEDTNEVLIRSVFALVEFEMQYCLIEHKEMSKGLERAKEDLNSYLAKR